MAKFNWSDFIDIALDIEQKDYMSGVSDGKYTEAYQRIMVANLYYGVFNLAVDTGIKISSYMETEEYIFHHNPGTVHNAIRVYFDKLSRIFRSHKGLRVPLLQLSDDLSNLHEYRKQCHYESEIRDLYTVCEDAMDIALRIRKQIEQVNNEFDAEIQKSDKNT